MNIQRFLRIDETALTLHEVTEKWLGIFHEYWRGSPVFFAILGVTNSEPNISKYHKLSHIFFLYCIPIIVVGRPISIASLGDLTILMTPNSTVELQSLHLGVVRLF